MKKPKRFRKLLIGLAIFIPTTSVAFMGVGDSGDVLLGKILAELVIGTQTLRNLLGGMDFLNSLQMDIRRGITDPLSLNLFGLGARDLQVENLLREAGAGPVLDTVRDGALLKNQVEAIWGQLPKTVSAIPLSIKDDQAIHALTSAAAISEEAHSFTEAGQTILDDLDDSREGKATIRHAQAGALQVQQLGQMEANQGLQISLAAQELLSRNEDQKAIHEINDRYLDMLSGAFETLKPMGPNE